MDKIIIYSPDKQTRIEMPRIRAVEVGGDMEYKETTMISGKRKRDILGYRETITAEWDWLPAQTITDLRLLTQQGQYLFVEYPTPEGEKSGWFDVPPPSVGIFKFNGIEPRWHGVSLKMTAQELRK